MLKPVLTVLPELEFGRYPCTFVQAAVTLIALKSRSMLCFFLDKKILLVLSGMWLVSCETEGEG